jgi:hypothetical protein
MEDEKKTFRVFVQWKEEVVWEDSISVEAEDEQDAMAKVEGMWTYDIYQNLNGDKQLIEDWELDEMPVQYAEED